MHFGEMADSEKSVTVSELYAALQSQAVLLAGEQGLGNTITSPRIQKLGLALAGYTDYLHEGRVQFVGRTEVSYLNMLEPEKRRQAVEGVFVKKICCIVITKNLEAPEFLVQSCGERNVPLLRTALLSSQAISEVTGRLEQKLAPEVTVHGVFVEVFGLGVLMFGESGVGKSECALDLIRRGHRLVSDDAVVIRKLGRDLLIGSGPPDFRFHMELRGLGIINIKDLFGVSALSASKTIDVAIELVRWNVEEEYDRLGLDERELSILNVSVPWITMPVASGRNLATLIEVAIRIRLLKKQGYEPAAEFFRRHEEELRSRSSGPSRDNGKSS